MGKSLKKLVVALVLVGVVGLVVSKLTGGDATAETESESIDRVTTRNDADEADAAEADTDADDEETDLEVEVESDDEEFGADLDLPAASSGLDMFDYLAVLAAAARAAYKEYNNRI